MKKKKVRAKLKRFIIFLILIILLVLVFLYYRNLRVKNIYVIGNSYLKEYEIIVIGPAYNYKEQSVQLIVKHKCKTINEIYMRIYQLYQKSSTTIIFDRYSKVIV